jgi:hypothetical protein
LSANNAIDLLQRRWEKANLLLEVRDRIAAAAAQYDAHDLDGANELVGHLAAIEASFKALAPRLHAAMWTAWIERDVELAHDSATPSPECAICPLIQRERHAWINGSESVS